jgi:hypothetical protein
VGIDPIYFRAVDNRLKDGYNPFKGLCAMWNILPVGTATPAGPVAPGELHKAPNLTINAPLNKLGARIIGHKA